MTNDATAALAKGLRGRLIQPADADYDAARALYNGMIDKRPAFIARVANVADVIAAVNVAREEGLLLAVRGGGHNGPGLGSCNGGLVIDLSTLKSVRVDPSSRTVRVDAGCTSGDVDHATHAFGLCSKRTSSLRTAALSRPARHSIPTCSGRCVAAAAISAS